MKPLIIAYAIAFISCWGYVYINTLLLKEAERNKPKEQ